MDDPVLTILIGGLFVVLAVVAVLLGIALIGYFRQRSMLSALADATPSAPEPPHPDHERAVQAAEYLSTALPPDLSRAAYAGAVLHWFDAQLLAALVPDWSGRAGAIYRDLQNLSFVETLAGGRRSIHTPTRTAMLVKLWAEQREEYQRLAARAAQYFSYQTYVDRSGEATGVRADVGGALYRFPAPNSTRYDEQIEWLYHLSIAHPNHAVSALKYLGNKWTTEQRFDQLDRLIQTLMEHVDAQRITGQLRAVIYYYLGRHHLRMKRVHEALEALLRARDGAGTDLQLWMSAVSAIGDTLPFFDAPDWDQLLPDVSSGTAHSPSPRLTSATTPVRGFRRGGAASGTPAAPASQLRRYFTWSDALSRRYQTTWNAYRVWGDRLGGYRRRWTPWDDRLVLDRHVSTLRSLTELRELYHASNRAPDEAAVVRALGDEYVFRHQFADALQLYQEALTLYVREHNRLGLAQTHKSIGDTRQLMGRHAEAIAAYDEALKLYRQLEPSAGPDHKLTPDLAIADVLLARGHALHTLSNLKAARDQYDEALAIYRTKGLYSGEAATLIAIGNLLELSARYDAAQVRYDEAHHVYERNHDRLGLAHLDLLNGDRALRNQQVPAALDAYHQALKEFKAELDHIGEAHALKALGDAYQGSRQSAAAIDTYQQALAAYQVVKLPLGEANVQAAWGKLYTTPGQRDPKEAVAHFEAALLAYRAASHPLGEADVQLALGQEYRRQGDYAEAQHRIEAASKLYNDLKHLAGQAHGLQAYGEVRLAQSDTIGALKVFQQAYHLFEQLGDLESEVAALTYIGHTQVALDRCPDAVRTYGHAITLAVSLPPEHRTAHGIHGYQALAHGDYLRAAAHFESAAQTDYDVAWKLGLGIAQYAQGKVAEARALLEPIWRTANADEQASALRWLEHIRQVKHEPPTLAEVKVQLGIS